VSRYRIARCPRCGRFLSIDYRYRTRRCPYCGRRTTIEDVVDGNLYSAEVVSLKVRRLNERVFKK